MKPTIKTDTWPNGQKKYEAPYVNGQRHGLSTWWHENGQKWREIPYINNQRHGIANWWHKNGHKRCEIPYVNGQVHGVVTWRHSNGSLKYFEKWHQGQWAWEMSFSSQEQIPEDAEVELFFHETPKFT